MIKNSIIYSIIFLAILGNFSCRKEWVKPDDIVQNPIDSTSNKINTFEYELKPGIIDVTSKARDLIIDETSDQLIVKRTLETENLFEVDKIYYHIGFDFTEFKNAYRIKEIKKENDRMIVEKRNLAFVDSYEKYHLINNNPESGKIKTRGEILQNDWNINFNITLPITVLGHKIDATPSAKAAGTFYLQEIKIAGGIISIFKHGLKILNNAEFFLANLKEPSLFR
ncbi:MAG: hypothetical protein IPL95_16680 [Saprospiraceae bacterium]|nr:hypothetical protein [Saprospiraceae bacterium]